MKIHWNWMNENTLKLKDWKYTEIECIFSSYAGVGVIKIENTLKLKDWKYTENESIFSS